MKRLLTSVLIVAMLGLTGCGTATDNKAAASGGKTIKVGLIAPLTGDVKTYGESVKNAFYLALEQAGNKAGDYTIQVVEADDHADATEGVNQATKLITQNGVKAIVGSVTSNVSIPVSELANQNKVVMITPTSTAAKVTVDDSGKRKPFVFRAPFIDPFQAQAAAKFAQETLHAKTAAIFYDKGNDYTVGLEENFKKSFEAAGGKVVAVQSYSKDDKDFSVIATSVAGQKPDMLYLPDYYQKVSLIANAAKAAGLNVPMVGADGWYSSDLDFSALAGGYFTTYFSADDPRPEVQQFVKDYQAKYKAQPDGMAALGYDAGKILIEAIKQANSNDPDKIRQAMQNLKDLPTVGGKVSFDANGNPVKGATILQVQANKSYKFIGVVNP
ncbi:MAG: ABC transporter substrate-binding protein [Mycobacterium leprae]